jgi:hypothetical protein
MKRLLTVLLFTAAALAAQASASTGSAGKKATAPKAAAKATAAKPPAKPRATLAQPLTIPKDAVENANGSYTWTDKQGKKWTFVKTPFGVSKTEADAVPVASASMPGVKAFDAGDKIRFEASTPFGTSKWEKNKADLTDEERALVNSQIASPNAKQE